MAYIINELITLGIGNPSNIPSLILNGLAGGQPVISGDVNNALTGNSSMSGGGDIPDED